MMFRYLIIRSTVNILEMCICFARLVDIAFYILFKKKIVKIVVNTIGTKLKKYDQLGKTDKHTTTVTNHGSHMFALVFRSSYI